MLTELFNFPKMQKVKKNLYIYGSLSLILAFIYLIITLRKTFVRINGRMPYAWDNNFNRTVHQYLRTQPVRNALVITGPYQSGKSRAIEIITHELRLQNQFVINADFSTAKTIEDIVGILKLSVYKGLSKLRLSGYQTRMINDHFALNDEDLRGFALDPALARIYITMANEIDEIVNIPTAISSIVDIVDDINPIIKSAVIIESIDNLISISQESFDTLNRRLNLLKSYSTSVPYIFELRDSTNRFLFSDFEVADLISITDPVRSLYVKNSVFTQAEITKLINAFGGHGGSFERAFEDIKRGITADESIRAQNASLARFVPEDALINRDAICGGNVTLESSEAAPFLPMAHSGFLFADRSGFLQFAHPGVRRVICGENYTMPLPAANETAPEANATNM